MFKHALLAAAAVLSAAPALAQAAPVEVELEGIFEKYTNTPGSIVVMGMEVHFNKDTYMHSPTTDRVSENMSILDWLRGDMLPGRTRVGFLGGTAIVTGVWDPVTGRITATDLFTEPSENVNLGAITANWCTTPNCDGPNDYLRGNPGDGVPVGPAMLPLRDRRMAAGPVTDEPGFALNLTGINLRGQTYVAEGYYGATLQPVPNTTGGTSSEKAFHYFHFGLANPAPQYYLNKGSREIAILRTDCREGDDDFEIRGFIHTRVSATGGIAAGETLRPNSGRVEVFYNRANGQLVRANATPEQLAGNSPVGRFRIRFDQPGGECPATIGVRWVQTANQASPNVYAQVTNVAVETRPEDPEDN